MKAHTGDQEPGIRTDRRRFLKKLAGVLAVGAGVMAAPGRLTSSAQAAIACCPNWAACWHSVNCGSDHTRYLYCEAIQCCVCWPTGNPGCQYIGGVPC
jgi:hypothetical protein